MEFEYDPDETRKRMAPGRIVAEGFLGSDERTVERIIAVDRLDMVRHGLDPAQVGKRLAGLTALALSRLGGEANLEGLIVSAVEARGLLPCPFGDEGLFPKAVIHAAAKDGGAVMEWSALSAHMAQMHGFFGGRGSFFRLSPGPLAKFLGLSGGVE